MQTRRLLYSPRCIGVAPLWVGSGKNSVRRSPSTSLTRGRLQTFTPPLSALPRSSNRKQRGAKERSPSLVVAIPTPSSPSDSGFQLGSVLINAQIARSKVPFRLHCPSSPSSPLGLIQQGLKRLCPHENPSSTRVRTLISPSSIWPRWAAT